MSAKYFPFKGIITDRPYPATGLTTNSWSLKSRLMRVPMENVYLTQAGVFIEPLFRHGKTHSGDDVPHVVFWRGNFYLEDGHHRIVRLALQGRTYFLARVFIQTLDDGLSER